MKLVGDFASSVLSSRFLLILIAVSAIGCQSTSVETRKAARSDAYSRLAPEVRTMVDRGQVDRGMSPDAVYIAWGQPDRELEDHREGIRTLRWIYFGQRNVPYRYWCYVDYNYGRGWHEMKTDYYPQRFIRAEAVFENGELASWTTPRSR